MIAFLSGVLVTAFAVAGLFFLRFWRASHDRLFAFFACAFFLLAIERGVIVTMTEQSPTVFLIRLIAFVLILWAIADKNFARRA